MASGQAKTVLVIGATGGAGGEAAAAFLRHGWRVKALRRQTSSRALADAAIESVAGDAMQAADVVAAAAGADVIVHGANPPGYHDWKGQVRQMLDNSIAAARASGAMIILPGNIYNFGPDAFPVLTETSPQDPKTRKGALRVEMEQRLAAVAGEGVRSVVLRCGDFFGPRTGNWFSDGLIRPGKPVTSVTYPGDARIGHDWAYLPDVGETMVRLAEARDRLDPFAVFHFTGHWLPEGGEMIEAIKRVVGNPNLPVRHLPWAGVALLSPFKETFREMLEMRYLWREPLRLDNAKLTAFLGAEPHTPLDAAVRRSLEAFGCIPAGAAGPGASRRAA